MSEGVKHDGSKPPMALVPVVAKIAMAEAFADGAKKYGKWNYKKGMEWTRLLSATERHLDAFKNGEDFATDSGVHHLGCAMADLAILLDYYYNKLGTDDRYGKDEGTQRVGASPGTDKVSEIGEPTIKKVIG